MEKHSSFGFFSINLVPRPFKFSQQLSDFRLYMALLHSSQVPSVRVPPFLPPVPHIDPLACSAAFEGYKPGRTPALLLRLPTFTWTSVLRLLLVLPLTILSSHLLQNHRLILFRLRVFLNHPHHLSLLKSPWSHQKSKAPPAHPANSSSSTIFSTLQYLLRTLNNLKSTGQSGTHFRWSLSLGITVTRAVNLSLHPPFTPTMGTQYQVMV